MLCRHVEERRQASHSLRVGETEQGVSQKSPASVVLPELLRYHCDHAEPCFQKE